MTKTVLPLERKNLPLSTGDFLFPGILCPAVHKGQTSHSSYWIPSQKGPATAFRINLKETAQNGRPFFEKAQRALDFSPDTFPYGFDQSQWWDYALAPHSYLALANGVYQIGLNFFNRFLHLDTRASEASLLDPGVNDELLSSTNWYDPAAGELWFASWTAEDTLKRNLDPLAPVVVTVWCYALDSGQKRKVWQGTLGDSLHQLSVSPGGRYLILVELGLRSLTSKALAPSTVLILDLQTLKEWRIELPTAAHVEFDPDDPATCYLSAHNIGLVGPKVGIYGPATLWKIHLTPDGPERLGHFTHQDFFRITTHLVFKRRQQTLLAASGYPGHLFLIDAARLSLEQLIIMKTTDQVQHAGPPHLCAEDSYGIAASPDGEQILVCTTGRLEIYKTETAEMVLSETIKGYDNGSCFTGHLGLATPSSGLIL